MELLNNHAKHQARMNKTPSKLICAGHGGYVTWRSIYNSQRAAEQKQAAEELK
jgi:hypothetical protein